MIKLKELFNTSASDVTSVSLDNDYKSGAVKQYNFVLNNKEGKKVDYHIKFFKRKLSDILNVNFTHNYIIYGVEFESKQHGEFSYHTTGNAEAFKTFSVIWNIIEEKLKEFDAYGFKFEGAKEEKSGWSLYKKLSDTIDRKTSWKLLSVPEDLISSSIDTFDIFIFVKSEIKNEIQTVINDTERQEK